MKKLLVALVALCTLAMASCTKETTYTVSYYDDLTSYANLTILEYSIGDNLLGRHEIKNVQNEVYEFTSTPGTDFVVIGCEGIMHGVVLEWYSSHYYMLDSDGTTNIDVDYLNMDTQSENPINPDHTITRYLN
jgi:hypothetical protein